MTTAILSLAALAFLAWGCETTSTLPRNTFTFTHEGRTYEIVGVDDSPEEGRNFLILREGSQILLRARDDEQDGHLDTLLSGNLSLEDANRIYAVGIQQAYAQGQYQTRPDMPSGEANHKPAPARNDKRSAYRILVFTKTAGYRHASIPNGTATLQALGAENNFAVDATEDAGVFSDEGLAPYQAVVFLSTSDDVLNEVQQAAFERYIRAGGGFAGIHAASDTEYDWPWYGGLVGAYFDNHPEIQTATITVVDQTHPSTVPLPMRWERTDEWYNFRTNPRGEVQVLATLDETTYAGGTMGDDHPIAWYHTYDGGRAWYTALGHTAESYADSLFQAHLLGGIAYAAGVTASN